MGFIRNTLTAAILFAGSSCGMLSKIGDHKFKDLPTYLSSVCSTGQIQGYEFTDEIPIPDKVLGPARELSWHGDEPVMQYRIFLASDPSCTDGKSIPLYGEFPVSDLEYAQDVLNANFVLNVPEVFVHKGVAYVPDLFVKGVRDDPAWRPDFLERFYSIT